MVRMSNFFEFVKYTYKVKSYMNLVNDIIFYNMYMRNIFWVILVLSFSFFFLEEIDIKLNYILFFFRIKNNMIVISLG